MDVYGKKQKCETQTQAQLVDNSCFYCVFGLFYRHHSARSDIKEKQDEVNQLSSQCETVENENKELQNNLDNGDKEDYIERIAREKYGYIKPGDRVYQDIADGE